MAVKTLSIFIDESGDFGAYEKHAPYYIVSMVLHDQSVDISSEIKHLDSAMTNYKYPIHAIHMGPLIRRESIYIYDRIEDRRRLFGMIYNFSRKIDFRYIVAKIGKQECKDVVDMTLRLSKQIIQSLRNNYEYISKFDNLIVYYDNGQIELTKILTSVFNAIFANVEFRKVKPVDYKLFQVADLLCTVELLAEKAKNGVMSKSEKEFFDDSYSFKKVVLKTLRKKRI